MRAITVAFAMIIGIGTGRGEPESRRGSQPEARIVSLREALAAAGRGPAMRVAAAQVRAAAWAVTAAGGWPPTTFAVSHASMTARVGATTAIPLPLFGTLAADRGVARAELDVARIGASSAALTARRDVTRAWIALARAEARAARSAGTLARQDRLVEIARAQLAAQDVSRADVVTSETARARARADAASDHAALAAAAAELAALLGWDAAMPLRTDGGLPALIEVPPLEALRPRRGTHPDTRAAGARVDAAAARVIVANRARVPKLTLDLEALFDDPTIPGNDFRVALSLELPLFGKGSAAERAALANYTTAVAERAAALATLDGEIVAAHRRYAAARARAQTLAADVLPGAREAADLARVAYAAGEWKLVAVLDAERELADTEAEVIEAHAEAATSLAELEWATGGAW